MIRSLTGIDYALLQSQYEHLVALSMGDVEPDIEILEGVIGLCEWLLDEHDKEEA